MKMTFILMALSILLLGVQADLYKKVTHNTDPQAKCLDGSPPIIYLHEGGDTKNILLYMIGGGVCMGTDLASTLESCYKRSKGQFGTSKTWPDTYSAANGGILDTDPAKNSFARWTKVVIMYCDGAFHQGNNLSPVKYKDAELYFRGAVNTRSHLKWADNQYNFSQADKIIVSGSSAGGIATYLWVDYLRTLVPNPKQIYGVSDSGVFYDPLVNQHLSTDKREWSNLALFMNAQNLRVGQSSISQAELTNADLNPFQILMQLSNANQLPPNRECSTLFDKDEIWKCLFIQFSYPTLKYPILFIESSYDQFVMEAVFSLKCIKPGASGYTPKDCGQIALNEMQLYRSLYIDKFVPLLLKWGHSLWSISCVWHAGMFVGTIYDSPLQEVPKNSNRTMRSAVDRFVLSNERVMDVDLFPWPANAPCAY